MIDSQLTVKTDNTSKNNEDDIVDSQLTVKTDNTSKGTNDNELDKSHHDDRTTEEREAIKDMELDVPKDGAPDDNDDNDKDVLKDNNDNLNDAEEEERSPKYETAREESNDSFFPTSSQMLTPLEPLASQQQQQQQQQQQPPNTSSAASSPLLDTQMTQPQRQQQQDPLLHIQATTTTTAASSLLLTQMTSDGHPPSILGSTQGTLLTTQMTQERQQQEEVEEDHRNTNSQETTISELQLGMTQSQQTTSNNNNEEKDKSQSQSQRQRFGENEKSPALFVDAKDEDFIEQFASKMNEKVADDECNSIKEKQEADGSDDTEKMEEEEEDTSVEEKDTKQIGTVALFETNESDCENDADSNGVGLLTQGANDDDDESMSDVNSVRTQESKGDKSSSEDDGDIKATSDDINEVVVDVIQERDIIINVQNDSGDIAAHQPLSGLTGPSQSQTDIAAQQKGLSQQSNGDKHVSFQECKQDNLSEAEKSPQLDLDATGVEKEEEEKEEEDGKDDSMHKEETTPQLGLPVTGSEKEEEEKQDGAIMNKEVASDDDKMIDVDDDSKHSSNDEEKATAEKISTAATAVTEKRDESQQNVPVPEQQNAGGNITQASDDEIVQDDDPQQTGDTIITTGSGSVGWSLYDGETQQLLSGPSQILTVPSKPSDPNVEMNDGEPAANSTAGINDDDAKMNVGDAADDADQAGTEDEYNQNELTQPLEKQKSGGDDFGRNNKDDKSENGNDDILVEMKHTQENGLPSALSYPNDHIEKDQSPVKANLDHTQNDHESQTQQSQDLLALTPVKEKRGSSKKSPARQKDDDEVGTKKASENDVVAATVKPTVMQKSSPKRSNETSVEAASSKKVESKWLSSTREEASPEGPRLVIPSFKSTENPTLDESEEEASDDEAWVGHGLRNEHPEDDIENTQEDYLQQQKNVSLKRLSVKRSRSPSNDSSTVDEAEEIEESFAPKVLRYGGLTKKSEPTDTQSQSSEAEFNEDYDDDNDDESEVGRTTFPQSQTDEAIKRQLKEIQEMTLPSTKQLKEIASRKRMSDQIAEMRERHEKEMKALKRENTKLRNAVKDKEEIIDERDRQLAEKNKLLKSQASVISVLKKKMEIVSSASVEEPAVSTEKQASTKKLTPTSKPDKKRKHREEKVDASDSDDDDIPLSALKGETAKKPSAAKAQSRPNSASGSKAASRKPINTKAAPAVYDRNGEPPAKVKASSTKKVTTMRPLLSNDLSKYWKELEEKGWSYKTGPEPYNKVYVPKDGATHMGCQLGIHFFEADQVIPEAIRRGDLNGNEPVLPSKENNTPQVTNQSKQQILWEGLFVGRIRGLLSEDNYLMHCGNA